MAMLVDTSISTSVVLFYYEHDELSLCIVLYVCSRSFVSACSTIYVELDMDTRA